MVGDGDGHGIGEADRRWIEDGRAVLTSRSNGRHSTQSRWQIDHFEVFVLFVESPGHYRSVILQGHNVKGSRRDRPHAALRGDGHIRQSAEVAAASPDHDRAVVLQGHAMNLSGRNRRHALWAVIGTVA